MAKDTSKEKSKISKPMLTPEAQENMCISLAMDLAEQQLRDGTASSQLITEFVKRGSAKARLENEKLKEENELLRAKTESLQASKDSSAKYEEALAAFKRYAGGGTDDIDCEVYEYDDDF